MRFRTLGSSDVEVSEISLGSWLTFSGGVAFERTRACTDAAFEAGITSYSMLWQAPEVELFPLCAEYGISQIVWSPLAQGRLTGEYRPGQAPRPTRAPRTARWAARWTS
jgi:aryl-alcohol dehydrogenase-like predicted oxidoreductase